MDKRDFVGSWYQDGYFCIEEYPWRSLSLERIYLPPALVEALGDLTEVLISVVKPNAICRKWNPPAEVVRALRAICQSHKTRPEDLRVFLDWAETAVMEVLLDE